MANAGLLERCFVITVRLADDDINRLLPDEPTLRVRYEDSHLVVTTLVKRLTVTAHAHFDLGDGHLRVAVPLDELAGVPRALVAMAWPQLLQRIERDVADRLQAAGLPWDLVWIDNLDDPDHGRVAMVNISPKLLNQVLRTRCPCSGFYPRLAGLRVEPEAVTLRFQLIEPQGVGHE